jgi:peptidyl-prolyl cis-trans isomerase C
MKDRTISTLRTLSFLALSLGMVFSPSPAAGAQPDSPRSESPSLQQAEGFEEAEGSGVVAEVNGEPIFLEHLERRLGAMHSEIASPEGVERSAPDLEQLMFRLVNDTLLAQEARATGMDEEPPIPGKLETQRRKMAIARLEREEIWEPATATDDEVRAAYEAEYRRVTLRVITTHEREEAEAVLAELEEGADFVELATERSVDPYQLKGGLVEDLPKLDLQVDIAQVAFDLEPEEVFGPVRTDIGWSVIKVESFQPADPEKFEARIRSVREMVRIRKAQALRTELAEALRDKHPVRIHEDRLAAIEAERQTDGRLVPKIANSDLPEDMALVDVGEEAISIDEFLQALTFRWKGIRNEEAAHAAVPILLEKKIEEQLVVVEALARGYGEAPEVRRRLDAMETELLVDRYLEEVIAPQVEITAEELEEYYRQHLDRFRRPPRFHVSQLTVETREKAEELRVLLKGGADFAWLAREHSIDRFQDVGGERGWVYPMPNTGELGAELLASDVGDLIGPLGVPGNWKVVRVNVREQQEPYPFQQVSGNVRAALFQEEFARVLDRLIDTLRSRSRIAVYDEVLATLRITGSLQELGAGGPLGDGHPETGSE